MKKSLFVILLSLFSLTLFAQLEVGIMFAPNLSINRIDGLDKDGLLSNYAITKNKAGMRFSAGPVVDIFMSDNIAISTGVLFTVKRASLNFNYDSTGSSTSDPVFNVQYVQIPFKFKFYTNEIASRMQLYFSLGGTLDTRIAENLQNGDEQDIDFENEFSKLLDAGLMVGLGVEKGIGQSNKVFAGLTYNRGLVNMVTKDFHDSINRKNGFVFNADLISLVAGFKF